MDEQTRQPGNDQIADMLERVADLLEAQHASVFRVRAYRAGARTVRSLEFSLAERVKGGEPDCLEDLPAIGRSLAALIREFIHGERPRLLDRLEGQNAPANLFATIPGIGEELAERIEKHLHVDTLEDLEAAAHDGRLDAVPGFGPRRVRAVQESLGHVLRHASRHTDARDRSRLEKRPSIPVLLEVDHRYIARSGRGTLRMIAPHRFNPERRAWLPVLHSEVAGWSMTAMFSNTARAHQLGRTGDWVVIYYERDGIEGQCTVVTEQAGPMQGQRVVRGREEECLRHYGATVGKEHAASFTEST